MLAPAVEGKSLEVLVIEDNPGDVHLILEGLRNSTIKNHVSVVSDGEEAIDFLFRRGRHTAVPGPDIILINFNIPRKPGWEVLAELEKDDSLKKVPVVVMTSREADRDVFTRYQLRVNCFMEKPLTIAGFTSIIQSFEQYWLSRGGFHASVRSSREKAGQR